jgi:hypothetical protein
LVIVTNRKLNQNQYSLFFELGHAESIVCMIFCGVRAMSDEQLQTRLMVTASWQANMSPTIPAATSMRHCPSLNQPQTPPPPCNHLHHNKQAASPACVINPQTNTAWNYGNCIYRIEAISSIETTSGNIVTLIISTSRAMSNSKHDKWPLPSGQDDKRPLPAAQ